MNLEVTVKPGSVRTEVHDEGPGFDPATTGTPRDNRGGWGLFLVERLSDRWGTARDTDGTSVWFELRRG